MTPLLVLVLDLQHILTSLAAGKKCGALICAMFCADAIVDTSHPHYMFYLRILYCRLRTGPLPFLLSVFVLCLSKYKTLLFGSTAYVGNVLF